MLSLKEMREIFYLLGKIKKGGKKVVLQYHSIDESGSPISVQEEIFIAQMHFLKTEGIKVIPLSSFIEEEGVAITFDDGFMNNYIYAFPILKEFGFCATFFIPTFYINKKASWIKEFLKREKHSLYPLTKEERDGLECLSEEEILSEEQIRKMSEEGMEFGAHSHTHPFLTEVCEEELEKEIMTSKIELEKILNKEVKCFCYPYGDYNLKVKEAVKRAGFLLACTTKEGKNENILDPFAIQRICVKNDLESFKFFILADTRWFFKIRDVFLSLRSKIG